MSFSFNFDVQIVPESPSDESTTLPDQENETRSCAAKPERKISVPTEPVKEALEHHLPSEPHSLLEDAVTETVVVGTLPPLHFLNESVFERTAEEREDMERILSRTAAQRSDLIPGVYEGGLKVWECTYDLLELLEREGETFGGRRVLDLGCGAGLLGVLALVRQASMVHFQDYNSTVIQQLTVPNVMINCQGDGEEEDDDEEEEEREEEEEEGKEQGEGKNSGEGRVEQVEKKKKTNKKEWQEKERKEKDDGPPAKKRAPDSSWCPALARCRFFSGDWTSFLALLLREVPSPKYDIIFTCETIYNTAYYEALHDTLRGLLAPGGRVYLATKAHYFGVGGGLHLFQAFVERRGVFHMKNLWNLENHGLQRHVVALTFKPPHSS